MTWRRYRILALALALPAISLFGAGEAYVGTWKLNPQKGELEGPGSRAIKNGVVTYELDNTGRLHKTLDGMDDRGRPVRNEDIIDLNGCDGIEHPLTSAITRQGRRIEFQGQVPAGGDDLLLAHYPFAPSGAIVTTSCAPNEGAPVLTTLIRRDGKLIKTSVTIFSANGRMLTEITTHTNNNGLAGDGEYGRSVTVWEK